MTALASIAPKISKLIPMLGSDKPGEIIATAAAIGRTLKGVGRDFHDLALAIEIGDAMVPIDTSKKAPRPETEDVDFDAAVYCRDRDAGTLTASERAFIGD